MAKHEINLKVGEMIFPFEVDPENEEEREKEEVFRQANREVNSYIARIKQQKIKDWKDQHYLAFAALNFAINNVNLRRSREVGDEDLRRLEALDTAIDTYMNSLR